MLGTNMSLCFLFLSFWFTLEYTPQLCWLKLNSKYSLHFFPFLMSLMSNDRFLHLTFVLILALLYFYKKENSKEITKSIHMCHTQIPILLIVLCMVYCLMCIYLKFKFKLYSGAFAFLCILSYYKNRSGILHNIQLSCLFVLLLTLTCLISVL